MHIEELSVRNFKTFEEFKSLEFLYPGREQFEGQSLRFPNINVILGNNGSGKSAMLKCIALSALGPAVNDSGIYPYRLVRRAPARKKSKKNSDGNLEQLDSAKIEATFVTHPQDRVDYDKIYSEVQIMKTGDLERMKWTHADEKKWHPIFSSNSDAFFMVGYGANRAVDEAEKMSRKRRDMSGFIRAQMVNSLFEETYSLIPLNYWLPELMSSNPGRYKQVVHLLDGVSGPEHFKFTEETEDGEFLFNKEGLLVPFPALSDGYRAFLGWVSDLLYHVVRTCPKGKKLVENHGIVLIDEIDLHLHPTWQMKILPRLSETFPNIQFIVTTHSPLVVGSIEWMNLIVLQKGPSMSSIPMREERAVYGLDADQILLTPYFGMESTRNDDSTLALKALSKKAMQGDTAAALQVLEQMSKGSSKT